MRNDYYDQRFWSFYRHFDKRFSKNMYLVFVEEVGPINPEGIMRPDERPFDKNIINEKLRDRSWRIRASGIRAITFQQNVSKFEVLDHDNVTDDERRQRKAQLNEVFNGKPLPIFDLYIGPKDQDYQYYRNIIQLGAWYCVVIGPPSDTEISIFIGAPELSSDLYIQGSLLLLEAVPLRTEYRLRDIFSLVHIPDADFGEDTGGSTEPLPPEPGVGPEPGRSEQPDLNPSTLRNVGR